jgi:hypothetical protein
LTKLAKLAKQRDQENSLVLHPEDKATSARSAGLEPATF